MQWKVFKLLNYSITKLLNGSRGVSSTVKLPVSKTGLGGSNPSAPARIWKDAEEGPGNYGSGDEEEDGKLNRDRR